MLFLFSQFKEKINNRPVPSFALVLGLLCASVFWLSCPAYAQASEITSQKLVELTNQEREKMGVNPLIFDASLYLASFAKANDMIANNYFDHHSPSGKSPWYFMKKSGYDYTLAGENLAMDFRTAEGVNKAWMNSSTHRENILNPGYENIAITVQEGQLEGHQTTLVVEMFGKKNAGLLGKINSLAAKITGFILGENFLNI